MKSPSVLSARIRGFRIVNVLGVALLLLIAVTSYALKARASGQDAAVQALDDQIAQENKRIRMLRLELATLGAEPRIEDLARRCLDVAPLDPRRDVTAEALPGIIARSRPVAPARPPAPIAKRECQ